MFFQLLFIHLYRPFLKYNRSTSPLPSHVSPRKFCTQAAGAISKLLRLYRRTYGLQQICNIAVYIAHSACTIHLLNLPDKNARRDIIHGLKHLEEIGEMWTCARRTLRILGIMAEKWKTELPEEAAATFSRTRSRWGNAESAQSPSNSDHSPKSSSGQLEPPRIISQSSSLDQQQAMNQPTASTAPYLQTGYFVSQPSTDHNSPLPLDPPSSSEYRRTPSSTSPAQRGPSDHHPPHRSSCETPSRARTGP